MTSATVHCQNLEKSFGDFTAVSDVSFSVAQGEILALVGPSGCGKTTTLRLIAGFEEPDAGRIRIGEQLAADGRSLIPPERRRVGMVFQDYAIFPHLSVADNVAFGLDGRAKTQQTRVEEMLTFVGLAGLGERMPHALSGGQQQRVALARALAPEPVVLLMDEPFSNLDAALRASVRAEVRQLLSAGGVTAIFVTHDQEEALFMGDQVAVMADGRLLQIGPPEAIFHRPQTRFVAEFMGQTDFVPAEAAADGVLSPLGKLSQAHDLPPGTPLQIAVRPDDVTLAPDEEGNGRILERQFIGIAYIYRVRLDGGAVVRSWQPHTTRLAPGTAVRVRLDEAHPVVCFHNGQALP
jgi:iron(III) transport system ATP-binding protein